MKSMGCVRAWVALAAAALSAALLAGCGGGDSGPGEPQFDGPDHPGPYPVGVVQVSIDDGQGNDRELPILIWYPAAPAPAEPDAGTAVHDYVLGLGSFEIVRLPSPMGATDAPPVDPRGPFPIVVFSHGNGGVKEQSVYLTEYLASHGFIVAAPDHVGNTIIDMATGADIPTIEAAVLRPTDVSRTLDAVFRESDDPASVLYDAADATRVGVAGHSFGGFTAFRIAGATIDQDLLLQECMSNPSDLCDGADAVTVPESQRDDRFLAALPQAPGGAAVIEPSMGFADVAVPTFIQGGTMDMTTPIEEEQRPPYEELTVPGWLMILQDAGHFTYSDMCRLLEAIDPSVLMTLGQDLTGILDDGCGPTNIPWEDAQAIIDTYSTDFFHAYVAMDGAGWGDHLTESYPHPPEVAEFHAKTP